MTTEIIAQILGFVVVIIGFLAYQVKNAKGLLAIHGLTCVVFAVHYLLLGAISAFVLNLVGLARDIVFYNKDKKFYNEKLFPVLFAGILLVFGIISWQGPRSLLVIAGMVIHTLCLTFKNPQNIRKSVLISSPLVILYDIFVNSIGGIIYESVAIVSAIIGIIRYKKTS